MVFLGDTFLNKRYEIDLDLDECVLNLEYPLSTEGTPALDKVNLGAHEAYFAETLDKIRPIAVNLANNHIMDYGEEAFAHTIEYLDRNKIAYFGAGREEDNYHNPLVMERHGKKIALMGYSCPTTHPVYGGKGKNGSACLDDEKIIQDIEAVKESVDMVIVNLHWGDEEVKYPKPSDVRKARRYVDAGADLIIGHHAHVIQSHEVYKDRHIFYGLGNFIFPDLKVPASHDGTDFQMTFTKLQNSLNRQALIVDLDPDLKLSYQTAVFDGERVRAEVKRIPRWVPEDDKTYDYYYRFWSKLRMIEMFMKNPRIPTLKQVGMLLSIKG